MTNEEAIEVLKDMLDYQWGFADFEKPKSIEALRLAIESLENQKTGHWISKPNTYGVVYCSECDYELHTNNTNYCANCGAKMEGE